jgi:hypothetical protein
MNPLTISKIITEDIKISNGLLLFEAISGEINAVELIPTNFPYLDAAKTVGLPTYAMKGRINLHNLYGVLANYAKNSGGKLIYTGEQGAGYDTKTLPASNRTAIHDIGDGAAKLINIALVFKDKDVDVSLGDTIRLSRGKRGSLFNPEDWARAVRMYPDSIIRDTPDVFDFYYGLRNDAAGAVLLASGRYAEGLYIIPTMVDIGGQSLDWKKAIEAFVADPSKFVDVGGEFAPIAKRVRLLFRKYLEQTGQGAYIDRARINPTDTAELFLAANNVDEFMQSYKVKSEAYERLGNYLVG